MSHLLAAAAGDQSLGSLWFLAPWILIFVIFYFLVFMPAGKERKARQKLLENLKKGDKVVTNGGFYGEVAKVEGQIVVLKLADNVKVRVSRQAIAGLEGAPAEKGK